MTLQSTTLVEPQVHLWTREEYYKLGEIGLFDQRRVELIEGVIFEMSPMGLPHANGIGQVDYALRSVFGKGWWIRIQLPLALGEHSDPEPDLAVVAGDPSHYKTGHPTMAALIVEVADTSLKYDQEDKASLYAKAGIPDYWILNLNQRRLEVRREPKPDPSQPFGFGYTQIWYFLVGDTVAPLAYPTATIPVVDLLP